MHKTRKIEEGVLLDLDEEGRIYGIVGASERMSIASPGKISIDVPVTEVPA